MALFAFVFLCIYLLEGRSEIDKDYLRLQLGERIAVVNLHKRIVYYLHSMGIYYENINNPKQFIKHSKEKFDTYSIGVTMKEFFLSSEFQQTIKNLSKIYKTNISLISIKKLIPKLVELIKEMTNINPIKRISIIRDSKKYNELVDIL